jgi:hypothetical protein
MNLIPNTIQPRTPLTVTELETLAFLFDSATDKMSSVRDITGAYAWPQGSQLTSTYNDIFGGFYQIRENTCILACGDGNPWDIAENEIRIAS